MNELVWLSQASKTSLHGKSTVLGLSFWCRPISWQSLFVKSGGCGFDFAVKVCDLI